METKQNPKGIKSTLTTPSTSIPFKVIHESLRGYCTNPESPPKFQELVKLSKLIAETRARVFPRNPKPKGDGIDQTWTDEEYHKFLEAIDDERYLLMFNLQQAFCCRISEICELHIKAIDFHRRTAILRIRKKRGAEPKPEEKYIPLDFYNDLVDYINRNLDKIELSEGFIFYARKTGRHRNSMHISERTASNQFRKYRKKAGFNQIMFHTRNGIPRYRFHTHSNKRTGMDKIHVASGYNGMVTQDAGSHEDFKTTEIYLKRARKEQLREASEIAFSRLGKIRKLQENYHRTRMFK